MPSSNIENNAAANTAFYPIASPLVGPGGGLPRIKRTRDRDMSFTTFHHLPPRSYDRRHRHAISAPCKPTTAAYFPPYSIVSHPAARKKNTMMDMVLHRSGAIEVKENIARIAHSCVEYKTTGNSTAPDDESLPPHRECSTLLYLARDAYYQVIIAKYGGIKAILDAMNTFPICADFLACCCEILSALCAENGNNKAAIDKAGGSVTVMSTIQNNPHSIRLHTSGCTALRDLMISAPSCCVEASATATAPTPEGIGSSKPTTKATVTYLARSGAAA
jgi:hypothetical protein